jgi:cerevisin
MKAALNLLLLSPLLAAASPVIVSSIHNGVAPLLSSSNSEELPNSYIVVFKKHVDSDSAAAHHNWVQDIHLQSEFTRTELRKRSQFPLITHDFFEGLKHTFNVAGSLVGYSGHFDEDVIEQVRRHPDVSETLRLKAARIRRTCDL